jgi:hypothetical protein
LSGSAQRSRRKSQSGIMNGYGGEGVAQGGKWLMLAEILK